MTLASMLSGLRRDNSRSGFFFLILVVMLYTAAEGVWSGWSGWIPGGLSRSRDAQAVAITAVAYGKWQGYASYRSVNRTLLEQGISVQEKDLVKIGAKHYFEVMTDAARQDVALKAASTLSRPEAEGMFYAQDEKGMAALYTLSFAAFGISSTSWYWFYILLYASSVFAACIAFRKRDDALFLILALVCVHAIVAQMLPSLPRQDITLIHSNRFLGIMASVAMFHLMLLMLHQSPLTLGQGLAAAFQTVVIGLTVNARTSAAWVPIAVILFWLLLWSMSLLHRSPVKPPVRRPVSWPICILALGLGGLMLHQQYGLDTAFRDGRAQGGHVFWHNVLTAVHNNPERLKRYDIPREYPVYDDQVSYLLFGREIDRRGEARSNYLVGDADWIYRTSSPDLDFRWNAYDRVLRDVFLNTVYADTGYVLNSFFVQQPKSAVKILMGRDFLRSSKLLCVIPLFSFTLGCVLVGIRRVPLKNNLLLLLVCMSFGVILPVLCAAVIELRLIEVFYVAVLNIAILFGFMSSIAGEKLAAKFAAKREL